MSIPKTFATTEKYFEEALRFLKDFSWIYKYPNTHILVESILNRIPSEWITYFKGLSDAEFNDFPFARQDFSNIPNCPSTLAIFLNKIRSLEPTENGDAFTLEDNDLFENVIPKSFNKKGLSLKKQHEIERLAPFIDTHCKKHGINIIIDIGSGLGYLSQLLYGYGKYKVLGIEADLNKLNAALKRQRDFFPDSINNVKYIQHFVAEDSGQKILEFIKETFFNEREKEREAEVTSTEDLKICITGLHACADLSVSVLKIFADLDRILCTIAMPCCYHRLQLKTEFNSVAGAGGTANNSNNGGDDDDEETFCNFPVSEALRRVYEIMAADKFLNGPFLRLACQQTKGVWKEMTRKDHEKRARDAMKRAVLQMVAENENYLLSRIKRKTKIRSSSSPQAVENAEFDEYLKTLERTHSVISKDKDSETSTENNLTCTENFKDKMRQEWSTVKDKMFHMECLSLLQVMLQSLCENIILLDRLDYVKELNDSVVYCENVKIMDDVLSPRCRALVACKV